MNRRKLDVLYMLCLIAVVWFLNISPWFKVPLTILCLIFIPAFPLFRLMISQIGAKEVSKEVVQSFMKLHQWYTIPELRRIMQKELGHRVSHHNLMEHVYRMAEEHKVEGRERHPPESNFYREANVWEYRRVL